MSDEDKGGMEIHTLKYHTLKAESAKAVLLIFDRATVQKIQVWLPKSQCKIDKTANEITVPEWLVKQNDLWDFSV